MTTDSTGEFSGRVALVTGGSRGIGFAIAKGLIDAGAFVVITGRSPEALAEAVTEFGPRSFGFCGDAVSDAHITHTVSETLARFGRLDILINNVAHVPPQMALLELPLEEFDVALRANLRAPLQWIRAAHRAWMAEHGGTVINVSSLGGMSLQPGMAAYGTSKAGLIHMTRYLAAECAPGIRVNAVAPGLIRTEQSRSAWQDRESRIAQALPAGRLGEATDVADAVLFLASDRASWITGETLVIDGGALVQWGRQRPPASR
jgi:NAD(P)-dependent dehydrogenase (short-subunit alcohol dehydrogenase family)